MSDTAGSSFIGSSLILAGTAIGAGMLALPLVAVGTGFFPILGIYVTTAVFAIYSGMLMLEANLAIEPGCNLYTMSSQTLGSAGRVISTIAPLGLFYALMTAYLSGGGALLSQYLGVFLPGLPLQYSILFFALFSGGVVYSSTRAVDYLNRLLFIVMIACLLIALLALFPQVNYHRITHTSEVGYLPLIVAIPVVYTSFGYHGSIPSIILYQRGNYGRVPGIILLATIIPLLVYSAWLISVMGNIPDAKLLALSQSETATAGLIESLATNGGNKSYLHAVLHVFSDFALLTSVLGVALGLFDYLAGLLQRGNTRKHRTQTALTTFTPPIVFAMTYPEGFISFLGFAAIPLSTLAILLPSAIVLHLRHKGQAESAYRAPGGNGAVFLCLTFGLVVIIVQLVAVSS